MSEPTKEELYEEAQELDIKGRTKMDKAELAAAIAEAKSAKEVEEETIEVVDEVVDEAPEEAPAEVAEPEVAESIVISQEPTTQGGLTFLTDRAQ